MVLQNGDGPVVWTGQPAWSTYVFLWCFVAILGIRGVIFLWLGYWISIFYHAAGMGMLVALAIFLRRTTRYRVTRQAVHRAQGILGKTEQTFPLGDIASVDQLQGPLDRLFCSGNVVLYLKKGTREQLAGVKDPEVVCRKIRALL